MAVITRISAQQKNTERFNVFIDKGHGEEFAFSVDADVLLAFHLKKGMEVDPETFEKILYEDNQKKALNKAIRYLSFRMRSIHEIRQYLKKDEIADDVIDFVIDRLKKYKYADDLQFAEMFVKNRIQTSTKGPSLIQRELQEKGVAESDIQKALNLYKYEEQIENSGKLASKIANQKRNLSLKEKKQKLTQQLLQKGFSWEVIEVSLANGDFGSPEDDQLALLEQARKAHKKYSKYTGFEYTMRMKRYLFGKGFSADLINEVLQNKEF